MRSINLSFLFFFLFLQRASIIIVPESSFGILEWASHRRMGCEIITELPMNWYKDDNLLGFVLFFYHVHILIDDDVRKEIFGSRLICELISHDDQSQRLDVI